MSDDIASSGLPDIPESGEASVAPEQNPSPSPEKFKLVVDGEEVEVDLEELKKGYNTNKAAQKRFQDGAMALKKAEALIHKLKQDPISVISDPVFGHDVDAIARKLLASGPKGRDAAEEFLAAIYQEEMLTPEQREAEQNKKELEEFRKNKEKQEQDEQQRQHIELAKRYAGELDQKITSALKETDLPKTNFTVKQIAFYLREGLVRGMDLDPRDVIPLVKEDYMNSIKTLLQAADGDTLETLIGPEIGKKLRQHDLKKVKNPHAQHKTPAVQNTEGKRKKNDRIKISDLKDMWDNE